MLPNFIYIGPDKSGSTWIYFALKEHPEVCLSSVKDIYFFDKYYYKGAKWYEKHFKKCIYKKNIKAIGELSHDYLFSETALNKIKNLIPDIKLITSLRNPVDRAFSDYLHLKKHGLIKNNEEFITALNKYPEIVEKGFYDIYLNNYFQFFLRDNFLVLFFDELLTNPVLYISKIYKFIGVDHSFKPSILNKKILEAKKPRNESVAYAIKKAAEIFRDLNLDVIVGNIKNMDIVQKLLYVKYDTKPKIKDSDKKYLLKIYEPHIKNLECLLNYDLSFWKE